MKTTFLTFIAIAGLIVLGTLGYLAFYQADVTQTDFEQDVIPASAAPTPAPVTTPSAAPILTPMQQAATPPIEVSPALEPEPVETPPAAAATAADENTVPLPAAQ